MRYLCCDPGTVNFGLSVIDIDEGTGEIEILTSRCLSNPVKQLELGDLRRFGEEITQVVDKYEITHIAVEKFVNRGIKGKIIECINVMIGYLFWMAVDRDLQIKTVGSLTWKPAFNRFHGPDALSELYQKSKDFKIGRRAIPLHPIDSVLIGLYCAGYECLEPLTMVAVLHKHLVEGADELH